MLGKRTQHSSPTRRGGCVCRTKATARFAAAERSPGAASHTHRLPGTEPGLRGIYNCERVGVPNGPLCSLSAASLSRLRRLGAAAQAGCPPSPGAGRYCPALWPRPRGGRAAGPSAQRPGPPPRSRRGASRRPLGPGGSGAGPRVGLREPLRQRPPPAARGLGARGLGSEAGSPAAGALSARCFCCLLFWEASP